MLARPRRLFLALVAIVAAFLVLKGLVLSGYEPETSDTYLWGAFHVHSTLSDGLAPLDEIARAAREARVSFILLSDHGAPHPEAATLHENIGGVRFIGGSEVGLPDGHLIVSDVRELPVYTLPPFPPDAVSDVSDWGGMSIVTYPEDPVYRWSYWEDDFVPDGIEIVNVTSYFRASSFWRKLSWAFFSLFDSRYYISGFEPPAYALERWDRLLERGPVHGFYATNAHGGFPWSEKRTIGVPSYRTSLGYVGLGVDPRYRDAPEEAIRRGEFFSIVRAAGEPERFEFVEEAGGLEARLEGGQDARIDLKRNGEVVASTKSNELRLDTPAAGAYRVEVYLERHPLLRKDVPWILSNPIFVGELPAPAPREEHRCDDFDALPLPELRLEKDDESSGAIELPAGGGLRLFYQLSRKTPERVDRWVALALRKKMDLSGYRGVHLEGSASPEPMRYWIEVRSGEEGHYASVKLAPEGDAVNVPWERFYPTLGDARTIPLAAIDAVFVTVNTSSSRTGFSAGLSLDALGFCR